MPAYQSIVILTGAGVSAESGIKTFRAADGLWENHRVEDVASPDGFRRDPELVLRFYNERRRQLLSDGIKDNAAHRALAKLENESSAEILLVTQNIDDLHERAGSTHLIHMHGELLKTRCTNCRSVFETRDDVTLQTPCPSCDVSGCLRPDIVWFGEMPFDMERIYDALCQCDCFISIGTSGNVYPAAGFVEAAAQAGAHTVELNLEPSNVQSRFAECIYGNATDIVPDYVERLLNP